MRAVRSSLALALVFTSAGCAGLIRQYDRAPNGLPRAESRLRDWLAEGRADSALARLARGEAAPGDDLLRSLFIGSAAYYAGDAETAGASFERASELAEERETKSVSRSALSLISNDLVLPYETSRTERLFIPYYSALARLRSGDVQGAAVEARRLSALLERYESDGWTGETDLRASLRFFAATVFDAAGERNDAAVAYRNAAALAGALVLPEDTLRCCHETDAGATGEVVVFIEQGYIAHRAPEALWVLLAPHELYAFAESEGDGRAGVAQAIARRVIAGEPPPRRIAGCAATGECTQGGTSANGTHTSTTHDGKSDTEDAKPYLLKVAWPVMRRPVIAERHVEVVVGDTAYALREVADVSGSVMTDFERERPLILARTIARAALKTALTKGAEKKAEEKDEGSGKIVGLLANAGSVLLEQADTRSWHLLPARFAITRIRLPAGRQPLVVIADGRRIELGEVHVAAGAVSIMATRIW